MRIALVTCAQHAALIAEDRVLIDAFARHGADAAPVVWDQAVAWHTFAAALVRTPWDYTFRRDEFMAWADRAAAATRLYNSAHIIRWSSHKQYLVELAAHGVPVVATAIVRREEPLDLLALARERGWDDVVVKPCVSAGARDTIRVRAAEGQAAAEAIRARGDLMVQPYQPRVEHEGERSLIFFEGQFSHAARKHPVLATASAPPGPFGYPDPTPAAVADDELAVARAVLLAAPEPLLYARVDLLRDEAGQPRLMELECLEPRLFFHLHPPAADTLVQKLLQRLA
jgi:glutathione synthase/RimK-type ligase-like ATP-grasp enzyme